MNERYAGPWCGRCGGRAEVRAESIDPRRPLGICRPYAPGVKGCGHVPLTRIEAEADAVYAARRRRLSTAHHAAHNGRNPWCDHCARTAAGREARDLFAGPVKPR